MVTCSLHKKNYQQPQSGGGTWFVGEKKEEDLVVHKVPREWALMGNFNSVNDDFEEDLDEFPVESKEKRPNLWLEHITQVDRSMDSRKRNQQRRFHPLFDGSTSWF